MHLPSSPEMRRAMAIGGLVVTVVVVVGLIVVGLVWFRHGDSTQQGQGPDAPGPSRTPSIASPADVAGTGGAPTTGATGATGTQGALPSGQLPTGGGLLPSPSPGSTDLDTAGAARHRVTVTVRSDATIPALAYQFRGQRSAITRYNVRPPVVITQTLSGDRPYAGVSMQLGPNGKRAACSVTIDGKIADARAVTTPFGVTTCLA